MNSWLLSGVVSPKRPLTYVEGVEWLERNVVEKKASNLALLLSRWCEALEAQDPKQTKHKEEFSDNVLQEWDCLGTSPEMSAQEQMSGDHKLYFEDTRIKPINFRKLFLRSQALEKLLKRLLLDPGTPLEVWNGLERLLHATLDSGNGTEALAHVVEDLRQLASMCCIHTSGIVTSRAELVDTAVKAICVLKIRADLEDLEMNVVSMKELVNSQESTSDEGGKDVAAARKSWQNGCALWNLVVGLQNEVVDMGSERESQYQDISRMLDGHLTRVSESHRAVEKKISHTQLQHKSRSEKRDLELDVLNERVEVAEEEVRKLQFEKQKLEDMLRKVRNQMEIARHHCEELKEDRNVFIEGETLLLGGLMHQAEELEKQGSQHSGEEQALEAAKGIVGKLNAYFVDLVTQGKESSQDLQESSTRHWLAVGEKYCLSLCNEIRLMTRQLQFYRSELVALIEKQVQISEMRMQSMVADMDRSRQVMEDKYLQAEAYTEQLIADANAVKREIMDGSLRIQNIDDTDDGVGQMERNFAAMAVEAESNGTQEPPAGCSVSVWSHQHGTFITPPTQGLSSMFQELSDLESEFRSVQRPNGLPDAPSDTQKGDAIELSFHDRIDSVAGLSRSIGNHLGRI